MEKNMQSIRPEALTDSELERMVYINDGKLPAHWTNELMKRFVALDVKDAHTPDPKQLPLFD
jgi:hypothetical protein